MIIGKCGYCSRNVLNHHKSIVCNHCKNWIHLKCSGISDLNASNSVKYADWFCTKCLSNALPFIQSDDLEISSLQSNCLDLNLDNLSNKYVNPFSLNSSLNSNNRQNYSDPDSYFFNDNLSDDCNYLLNSDFNNLLIKKNIIKDNSNCFSALNINIRSLQKNFDQLQLALNSIDIDFQAVCITETWLTDTTPINLFNIPGKNFIHKHRTNKIGGGVGIYLNNNLDFKLRPDLDKLDGDIECIFAEINMKNHKNMLIGSIYRPPQGNIKSFIDKLNDILNVIKSEKKIQYIMGDFNINLINYHSHYLTNEFVDMIYSFYSKPLITKPTRITSNSATLIDNIFTNDIDNIVLNGILYLDISDHLPSFVITKLSNSKCDSSLNLIIQRDFNNNNLGKFKEALSNTDWSNVLSSTDANVSYNNFLEKFSNTYNSCFPTIKRKSKQNVPRNPWITSSILKSIKHKYRLYKKFIKVPSTENKGKYKTYKNLLSKIIKTAKRMHYCSQLESSKHDIKSTWKILNEVLKRRKNKTQLSNSFLIDNKETSDLDKIVNEFCNFFTHVGPNLAEKIPKSDISFNDYLKTNYPSSFFVNPVTSFEIVNLVLQLKSKSSCGYDDLNPKILKSVINSISLPLTHIFNSSLSQGIFPDQLKIAKVIPIYKADNPMLFSNYRPISILPFFSKILEKLMYKRLINYLEKHSILSSNQFGFRSRHSTTMAVLSLAESIQNAIDQHKTTIGVYLDLSKAFDTVNHEILISKLEHYGIRGVPLQWFKNYLSNRLQYVQIKDCKSKKMTVKCGVPQGSVLGPVLFLLYINDIQNASTKLNFILFADDTNVFLNDINLSNLVKELNGELINLSNWFKSNRLSLNIKKTKFQVFVSNKKKKKTNTEGIQVRIDNINIDRVESIKFLGIIIDSNLNWNKHIDYICQKISKNIGIIRYVSHFLPQKSLLTLYYSLVYPYFFYGNIVWANCCPLKVPEHNIPTKLNRLVLLQKKVIRIISLSDRLAHTKPLFETLRILQFHQINFLETAMFMYKLTTNLLPDVFDHLLITNTQIHSHNTRQSDHLHVPFKNSMSGQNAISYKGKKLWNSLSSEMKSKPSVHSFKNSIHKSFF